MFLKICGITRLSDARHAVNEGATALGFVLWPSSPRYVAPERAAEIIAELPAAVTAVGVFVNETIETISSIATRTGLGAVQLHGDEPPRYARELTPPVLRSVTVENALAVAAEWPPDTLLLLDAADRVRRGGTGTTVDWGSAATLSRHRRVVLAGGLTPANVAEAIATVHPYGVDVSSGVEEAPGVKSSEKMSEFLANARRAFDSVAGGL